MASIERESINFKLPKTLTKALRTAARERHTTAAERKWSLRTTVPFSVIGATKVSKLH
ncbi:hypothetical protein [Nostoc sp. 106C]|uniref:hypothetical protein n=1 Tax=Nostoc sp. 106C TaxID=1932667 RepID=UPI001411E20E|nr:hypothetical protein [Nostoc sp. 106C]